MDLYNVEIFMTGTASDGRAGYKEDDLQRIVEDTNEAMINSNLQIPIKLGHDDPEQWAKGWVKNVRRLGNKIVADLFNIPEDIYNKIKDGYLPFKSIEIISDFITSAGKKLKEVIFGLAILGTTQPAFPYLKDNQTGISLGFLFKRINFNDIKKINNDIDSNVEWFNKLFDKSYEINDIVTSDDVYRCTIKNQDDFQGNSFKTIDISKDKGIYAVIGLLKDEDKLRSQSYLFKKDKWDKQGIIGWVNN